MEYIPVELWINEEQEEKWNKEAKRLNISLFSYIRRAVNFYYEITNSNKTENICKD